MKKHVKPFVALASGAVLFSTAVGPSACAQSTLVESGTSVLADVFGVNSGPETLSVSWFVVENTSTAVYTYAYNIFNPSGDIALPGSGSPGSPETFSSFSLSFNALAVGAVLNADQPVNGSVANLGLAGLAWSFPSVNPGATSPLLAFQSAVGPTMGNAAVSDGQIPPAPWTSVNNGQQVPVPRPVPEPEVTALLGMAFLFVPFRSIARRFFRRG